MAGCQKHGGLRGQHQHHTRLPRPSQPSQSESAIFNQTFLAQISQFSTATFRFNAGEPEKRWPQGCKLCRFVADWWLSSFSRQSWQAVYAVSLLQCCGESCKSDTFRPQDGGQSATFCSGFVSITLVSANGMPKSAPLPASWTNFFANFFFGKLSSSAPNQPHPQQLHDFGPW